MSWSAAQGASAWCSALPAGFTVDLQAGCGQYNCAYVGPLTFFYSATIGDLVAVIASGGDGHWCVAGDETAILGAIDSDGGVITTLRCAGDGG